MPKTNILLIVMKTRVFLLYHFRYSFFLMLAK